MLTTIKASSLVPISKLLFLVVKWFFQIMSRFFGFVIFFIFLILHLTNAKIAVSNLNTNNPRCTEKRLQQTELAVAKMIGFGTHGRAYPDSLKKVNIFCKQVLQNDISLQVLICLFICRETARLVRQVENFIKECFRKEISDMTSVVLYSVKSHMIRQYCGKTKNRKRVTNLVKVSPCLNKYFLPNDLCISQFINQTKSLINIKNDKLKIPHTCW